MVLTLNPSIILAHRTLLLLHNIFIRGWWWWWWWGNGLKGFINVIFMRGRIFFYVNMDLRKSECVSIYTNMCTHKAKYVKRTQNWNQQQTQCVINDWKCICTIPANINEVHENVNHFRITMKILALLPGALGRQRCIYMLWNVSHFSHMHCTNKQ
jgi:hypothetical protein